MLCTFISITEVMVKPQCSTKHQMQSSHACPEVYRVLVKCDGFILVVPSFVVPPS